MIKESIKELITAIAEGDSIAIENSFNTVMASKISDRLDDMRVSVAQGMFGSQVVEESVELDEDLNLEDFSIEELEEFMMSEEFEQLDELSKQTLGSYIKKASDSYANAAVASSLNPNMGVKHMLKRRNGLAKATDKLTKEEVEKLDELSKQTLGSYIKKAAGGVKGAASQAMMAAHNPGKGHFEKAVKRVKGIEKATDKLTKEEVEELEELSKQTLGSYIKKASDRSQTLASVAANARRDSYDLSSRSRNRRESGDELGADIANKHSNSAWDRSNLASSKQDKHSKGIAKAVSKLTKEEVED